MQDLEQQNLISGVVLADDPSKPKADSCLNNVDNPESSQRIGASHTPELIEEILDKAINRFSEQLNQAEKRGFEKAIQAIRENPSAVGLDTTVPNFLSDIKPDIWER